jgi:1-acyl-sn-glycerol-3-phosphate acyltransferase
MTLVRTAFKTLPRLLWSLIWTKSLYLRRNKVSQVYKYQKTKKFIKKETDAAKIVYHYEGLENWPIEESFLVTPNHQSALDCLVFFDLSKDPIAFVGKAAVKHYPIINNIMSINDSLFLERTNLRQEIKVMKQVKENMEKKNVRYIIFPEGTRTKKQDLSLGDFKAGTFKYTMSIKKKIVPVALYGNTFISDKRYKNKVHHVFCSILPALSYEDYKDMTTLEVASKVQNMVQEEERKLEIKFNEIYSK